MRINKFLAQSTGISRRAADDAIANGLVSLNGQPTDGAMLQPGDSVTYRQQTYYYDGAPATTTTIMLHKPVGYVVSRDGQGSQTVYELLPSRLHHLKPVGRLDKQSSGLLLLTDDGDLANRLTHPRYQKTKRYEVRLDKSLAPLHRQMISDYGVRLDDGVSRLELDRLGDGDDQAWAVTMREGRNRQIRRTFEALGYGVTALHRTSFGNYQLAELASGQILSI